MKPKRSRHESSSEDSEVSEPSVESISSSESDSEDTSVDVRHKKKRKRAGTSDSESNSDDTRRRSKKRKHKKKKRRHSKKKRREDSDEESESDASSASDDDVSHKKKRKRKHKHKSHKRHRSSLGSAHEFIENVHEERRLQSVVKERRASSEDSKQPSHTYYQKEYHRSPSVEQYEDARVGEVERFYHGSSKERTRPLYPDHYDRDQNRYEDQRQRYQHQGYNGSNQEYNARKREYGGNNHRNEHYEERRLAEGGDYRRPRDEPWRKGFQGDGIERAYQHHNVNENRPGRKMEYGQGRDFHARRLPQQQHPQQRFRDRENVDKRERFEEATSADRSRDMRRERPVRHDKPLPEQRERSGSQNLNRPNREQTKRTEDKRQRDDNQYRERADGRREKEHQKYEREKSERKQQTDKPQRDREDRHERNKDDRNIRSGGSREGRGGVSRDRPIKEERVSPKEREKKSRFSDMGKEYTWGKTDVKQEGKVKVEKEKPNFGLSGKLTADANTVNGIVIKYTEPDDAKQPKRRWRFYPFKGDKALSILYIHRQSYFLMGREKKVVDILLEHPSVSKQHAALQYRATPFEREDGTQGRRVRPYIIDLESANGTFVNNKKIDPCRYVELMERDVVKFGFSQREYVLLHENSKDDAQDDDHQDPVIGANIVTTEQIKRDKRAKEEMVEDGE